LVNTFTLSSVTTRSGSDRFYHLNSCYVAAIEVIIKST
jgi:hypothetical protein